MVGRVRLSKAFIAILLAAFIIEPVPVGVAVSGASPLNTGHDGTSLMHDLLEDLGYDVELVQAWSLARLILRRRSCEVLLIISPEKPYTSEEIDVITGMVRGGAHLIIADEGLYSNALLEALESRVRIAGSHVSFSNSYIFPARVSLDNFTSVLYFAYASPVVHDDSGEVVASRGGVTLGVRTGVQGSKIYVFGDGSIFTNAALASKSRVNPYVQLVNNVFSNTCLNGTIYMESSKYGLRPLTQSEILDSGKLSYVIAAFSNPFRYVLLLSQGLSPAGLALLTFTLLTVLVRYFLSHVMPPKTLTRPLEEVPTPSRRRAYVTSRLRKLVCSDESPEGLRELCDGGRSRLGPNDLKKIVDWITFQQ